MAEKRILLVEDEEDVREFLALSLRGAGYSVDAVATVAEANQRLQAMIYGLVIADWRLPDGNGADSDDVARSFRDHVARSSDMMSPALGVLLTAGF
jgi:DNA-binding response OmpR family regulator